jgi:hypothetical protein
MTVDSRLWKAIRYRTLPTDLLIVGPAGTGKTWGILRWIHCLARDNRDLRILISRKTRASLTESVLVTYEQEILPLDGMQGIAAGVKRRVRQSYVYPSGSEIVLGGLDDADRILSTAWDLAYINEAIEATEQAWETLKSRMARPGRSSRFGYLLGDTNPGHPDHWLKKRGDAGRTRIWDTTHEANPALFDGRRWTPAGVRYFRESLDHLTGSRRVRLRDGIWAVGDGAWFDAFDPARHVTGLAEFDPALPAFLAVDPGVITGAVLFQVRTASGLHFVNVFGDYLSEGLTAEANARAIKGLADQLFPGQLANRYCDPAGGARNPIGPTVMAEYARAGLVLQPWARANPSVADSLALVEGLLDPVNGVPRLTVHPRCRHLVSAFGNYQRAKRAGQWMDWPEDPQHPAEDLIDALKGGLYARIPARKTLIIRKVGA